MNDCNNDSQRLLLETVAAQAKTIQAQAETIRALLGETEMDETGAPAPTSYMDGTPVR